jgi:pyruvate dehydrogenase E1 component alpha subunit
LVEAETYRFRGHSMSDPGKYRTREEVEEMMKLDPIARFARHMVETLHVPQSELEAIDVQVQTAIEAAARFALKSPWPETQSMFEDVYVRSPFIHAAAAEKDPAWRAALRDDRVVRPPEGP